MSAVSVSSPAGRPLALLTTSSSAARKKHSVCDNDRSRKPYDDHNHQWIQCGNRRRRRRRVVSVAALVEARPQSTPPEFTSNRSLAARVVESSALSRIPTSRDRADDIQAEAKAMARASDAPVYSADLLALKYASRPLKVPMFPAVSFFFFFFACLDECNDL